MNVQRFELDEGDAADLQKTAVRKGGEDGERRVREEFDEGVRTEAMGLGKSACLDEGGAGAERTEKVTSPTLEKKSRLR
jgi:hypothetical protein